MRRRRVPDECDPDDDDDGWLDVDNDPCPCGPQFTVYDCHGQAVIACTADFRPPSSLFDYDYDCDVDQEDVGFLQRCLTTGMNESECPQSDMTGNEEVNAAELLLFAKHATGPGIDADARANDCNHDGIHDTAQDFNTDTIRDGDADCDAIPYLIHNDSQSVYERTLRSPCTGGNTGGEAHTCDDNCPCTANPDQADDDGDGVGEVCDNCSAERCPGNAAACANSDQRDSDGDRVGDVCDNCPQDYNPNQVDNNDDGTGDACQEPLFPNSRGARDPDDVDADGILNLGDNCPWVANPDQTDGDTDGAGDACDNCAVANSDQADMDADGIGDVCDDDRDGDGVANAADNCPDHYDPGQWDMDADGVGDLCDSDMDGDGIPEDWDGDGNVNSPCTGGSTTNCDDNCPYDLNSDQTDWDGDGIGNACDDTPGDPPEGEGMRVLDPLAMNSGGETESFENLLPVPAQGAMAYFVTHDGAGTTVDLPAAGGTVSVDLVVASSAPLDVWEVTPAISVGDVVSIDASGWSQDAELMAWTGLSSANLPSRYNCGALYWIIVSPQGQAVCQAWAGPICAERLLTPGARALTGSYGLDAVAGPINTPTGAVYTTASPLGALTSRPIQARGARVATLTLNVTGVPGTYQLTLTNGTCYSAGTGENSDLATGPAFEIRVGGGQ